MSKVPKSAQEKSSSQAWGLPFKGITLFTLTSMVMSSIIMEVIHMYVSIAIKLSKYHTRPATPALVTVNEHSIVLPCKLW